MVLSVSDSSRGASRLKPEGINVHEKIDAVYWFLNDKSDVRSSYYLEDPAAEFDIQGLELDWVGVWWDADPAQQAMASTGAANGVLDILRIAAFAWA